MLFVHGFEFKNTLNKPQVIYITVYAESAVDKTDHFAHASVRKNVAHRYDVVMISKVYRRSHFV